MNAKQWLQRAYNIDKEIQSKHEQIEMWECLAQKCTADFSGVPGGSNSGECRLEKYCIKIADAETEIKEAMASLIAIKQEIASLINKVPYKTQRLLLEQRYLLGKRWDDIGVFLNYSEQYIKQELHPKALYSVGELLKDNT